MQEPIQVRGAGPGDLDRIRAIEAASAPLTPWPASSWRAALNPSSDGLLRRVLLAERGTTVTGFIAAACVEGSAEIETLAVDPSHRRKGIARRLIQQAAEWAATEGARKLHLEVRASNAAAIRLYRSLGFEEQGIRRRYYADPVEDAVRMSRILMDHFAGASPPAEGTL